jgi:enamine deaminase RidA (YjgF/YER057c/UK114 family)
VRTVVEAAGCTMRDVVRLQTFLTRPGDIGGFMKAREELFPDLLPGQGLSAEHALVVGRLVRPRAAGGGRGDGGRPAQRVAKPAKKKRARRRR